jgi:hypothetical protein
MPPSTSPRDRAADDVDHAQRQRALLLGLAQRRQRVGGLADWLIATTTVFSSMIGLR